MLVPCVIPFWLLALYVLLASAAFSDQNGLLCARQRPAQLHIHENRNYQQQMSLQPAIESASSRLLLRAAFTSPSFKHSDTRTLAQVSTHTNSTQLAYGSDGLWAGDSRPFRSQGESLNDGLIPRIEDMNLAKDTDDSEVPLSNSSTTTPPMHQMMKNAQPVMTRSIGRIGRIVRTVRIVGDLNRPGRLGEMTFTAKAYAVTTVSISTRFDSSSDWRRRSY
ncbi:hypothetical protein KCU83_g3997, partial [Aureobasidium melanogenum]